MEVCVQLKMTITDGRFLDFASSKRQIDLTIFWSEIKFQNCQDDHAVQTNAQRLAVPI